MAARYTVQTSATHAQFLLKQLQIVLMVSSFFAKFHLFAFIGCSATALSRDHKPDDPEEAKVIVSKNGRIDSYRDQLGNQIGPMRVWLKSEDIPGLAMTRSFGDAIAARVGVNAVPEIQEFTLETNDKIIVLASDGVWEFLEN